MPGIVRPFKSGPSVIGTVEAQTVEEAKFKAKHEFPDIKIEKVNKDHTVYNVWAYAWQG